MDDTQLFFVSGLPKTGTTWLMRMLDGVDGICCRGEGRFFSSSIRNVPSLWDSLANAVEPWSRYVATRKCGWTGMSDRIETINRNNYLSESVLGEWREQMVGFLTAQWVKKSFAETVGHGEDVGWVGDKTPATRPEELSRIHRAFPSAKLLLMQRGVKDFVVSYLFHFWRAMREKRPDRLMNHVDTDDFLRIERYSANPDMGPFASVGTCERLARVWCVMRAETEHLHRRDPDRVWLVRYEDLRAEPRAGLRSAVEFLGLTPEESVLTRAVADASVAAVRSVSDSFLRSHIRSGVPGDWKRHLSAQASEAIDRVVQGFEDDAGETGRAGPAAEGDGAVSSGVRIR